MPTVTEHLIFTNAAGLLCRMINTRKDGAVMDRQEYKEIAAMAANGDMKAFARLYETIYREMYYAAYYSLAGDSDAVRVITETVREGFKVIGRLHTETAFRTYMMKTLCTKIRGCFKEYAADGVEIRYDKSRLRPNEDGIDIRQEFNRLSDTERLVTSLYAGGRFKSEEISQFTGLSVTNVKRKLDRALASFALD